MPLSREDMPLVSRIVSMRLQPPAGMRFRVYPPKQVQDDPSCLDSDDPAKVLDETVWRIRFQNGLVFDVSFPQLMAITYQLRAYIPERNKIADQIARGSRRGASRVRVKMKLAEIMDPSQVKELLASLKIDGIGD